MADLGTKQFRYNVYYPSGEKTLGATATMSDTPTLPEIKDTIGHYFDGADLLHISIPQSEHGGPADMFVGGNSIQKGLPRNDWATRLYRLARQPRGNIAETLPHVAGVAVVFEGCVRPESGMKAGCG